MASSPSCAICSAMAGQSSESIWLLHHSAVPCSETHPALSTLNRGLASALATITALSASSTGRELSEPGSMPCEPPVHAAQRVDDEGIKPSGLTRYRADDRRSGGRLGARPRRWGAGLPAKLRHELGRWPIRSSPGSAQVYPPTPRSTTPRPERFRREAGPQTSQHQAARRRRPYDAPFRAVERQPLETPNARVDNVCTTRRKCEGRHGEGRRAQQLVPPVPWPG